MAMVSRREAGGVQQRRMLRHGGVAVVDVEADQPVLVAVASRT